MCVTLLGILMLSKLAHPLKAEAPIEVISLCNNTLFKLIQFSKALESILITLLLDIFTLISKDWFLNASSPIEYII